jgi:hypothetical protein
MALEREPEKPEMDNFQCTIPATEVQRYKALEQRAKKQRVVLRKEFAKQFTLWLDSVEKDLNDMAPVRPIRAKAEE